VTCNATQLRVITPLSKYVQWIFVRVSTVMNSVTIAHEMPELQSETKWRGAVWQSRENVWGGLRRENVRIGEQRGACRRAPLRTAKLAFLRRLPAGRCWQWSIAGDMTGRAVRAPGSWHCRVLSVVYSKAKHRPHLSPMNPDKLAVMLHTDSCHVPYDVTPSCHRATICRLPIADASWWQADHTLAP